MRIEPIARIKSPYGGKFGVPRQSSLETSSVSRIEFEKPFRRSEALRGLEGFNYIWLIWGFSENGPRWEPTVRPPRLGGNVAMGVWATRSTFRPNALALSCVKLECVDTEDCTLTVRGADLCDNTPIYDIKPYIPYADCRPDARGGWTDSVSSKKLDVKFAPDVLGNDTSMRNILADILSLDPRPSYQNDPARIYGMDFGGRNIRFTVDKDILTVIEA